MVCIPILTSKGTTKHLISYSVDFSRFTPLVSACFCHHTVRAAASDVTVTSEEVERGCERSIYIRGRHDVPFFNFLVNHCANTPPPPHTHRNYNQVYVKHTVPARLLCRIDMKLCRSCKLFSARYLQEK